jgi:hypothetical protein
LTKGDALVTTSGYLNLAPTRLSPATFTAHDPLPAIASQPAQSLRTAPFDVLDVRAQLLPGDTWNVQKSSHVWLTGALASPS